MIAIAWLRQMELGHVGGGRCGYDVGLGTTILFCPGFCFCFCLKEQSMTRFSAAHHFNQSPTVLLRYSTPSYYRERVHDLLTSFLAHTLFFLFTSPDFSPLSPPLLRSFSARGDSVYGSRVFRYIYAEDGFFLRAKGERTPGIVGLFLTMLRKGTGCLVSLGEPRLPERPIHSLWYNAGR